MGTTENYGFVLKDCSRAITLNPKSSKAFYRSASALVALDRPEEAVDACVRCLSFDPNNAGVKILKHRAEVATAANQKKEADREARRRNEESLANKLKKTFRVRMHCHSIILNNIMVTNLYILAGTGPHTTEQFVGRVWCRLQTPLRRRREP